VSKHTPLPFKVAQTFVENSPPTWNIYTLRNGKRFNGDCVAVCDNRDDAEFIVRACNCHEELVAACYVALGDLLAQGMPRGCSTFNLLSAAIAKAEGKSDA